MSDQLYMTTLETRPGDQRTAHGGRRGFRSQAGDWRRTQLVTRKPVPCETERSQAAWQAVLEADRALSAAESDLTVLPADRDQEARAIRDADVEAVREGKSLPKAKATDWDAEERRRRAVMAVKREQLAAARATYDAVATEEAPKRAGVARERLTAARAALAEAAPALLDALQEFHAARASVEALVEEVDPQVPGWVAVASRDPEMQRALRELRAAGPAIRRAVDEDAHPIVTGAVFLEERGEVVPPMWWRALVHRVGTEAEAMRLAQIEAGERYRVSAFERELGERYFPPDM